MRERALHKGKTVAAVAFLGAFHLDSVLGFSFLFFFLGFVSVSVSVSSSVWYSFFFQYLYLCFRTRRNFTCVGVFIDVFFCLRFSRFSSLFSRFFFWVSRVVAKRLTLHKVAS